MGTEFTDFYVGQSVTYVPDHGRREKGVVKSLSEDGQACFVVYNCGGEWHRYKEFTAARTNKRDLIPGWHE